MAPQKREVWQVQTPYNVGDKVEYGGVLYRCIQAHTVFDASWTPPQTPALWVRVDDDNDDEEPEPPHPSGRYRAQGVVTTVEGTPCIGFVVKLVDVELRTETELGTAATTAEPAGTYSTSCLGPTNWPQISKSMRIAPRTIKSPRRSRP